MACLKIVNNNLPLSSSRNCSPHPTAFFAGFQVLFPPPESLFPGKYPGTPSEMEDAPGYFLHVCRSMCFETSAIRIADRYNSPRNASLSSTHSNIIFYAGASPFRTRSRVIFRFPAESRPLFPVSPLGRKPALSSTRWEARFPGSVYAWTSHSPGCREAQITMAFTSSQTEKLVFVDFTHIPL